MTVEEEMNIKFNCGFHYDYVKLSIKFTMDIYTENEAFHKSLLDDKVT